MALCSWDSYIGIKPDGHTLGDTSMREPLGIYILGELRDRIQAEGWSSGDEVPVRCDTELFAYGGCGPVVSTLHPTP